MLRNFRKYHWLLILLFSLFFLFGCQGNKVETPPKSPSPPLIEFTEDGKKPSTKPKEDEEIPAASEGDLSESKEDPASIEVGRDLLKVHFIDIGQGDASLIQLPDGKTILIDGGDASRFDSLKEYLEKLEINKIDFLIATHPHADHIGGLIGVIKDFTIGKIYAPKVSHTTQTFLNFLEAIDEKGLKITTAKAGVELDLEGGPKAVFLAPIKEKYDNLNNYSGVLKLTYGELSFLFTGDAEKESEKEMLEEGKDLKAQVLKVGHHGSNTSSTLEFLKEVDPIYGIISLGEGNSYGHPHQEVLDRMAEVGISVFRTDEVGSIIIQTDGKRITGFSLPDAETQG